MRSIPAAAAPAALALATLSLLAGCSVGSFSGGTYSSSPSPTKTFSTSQGATPAALPPDDSTPAESGPIVGPDGSLTVCNGLSAATVSQITGLKLTNSTEGDPDTFPGSGYTTYGCIYYGADPSTLSVLVNVEAGAVNQAFQDNSDGIKPTFGWGPIEGVGDRAEGDGLHVLDVLWGSRYVIQVVDNTPDSDVGVKNMAALATALHEKLGD